jgi:hypothetical protein
MLAGKALNVNYGKFLADYSSGDKQSDISTAASPTLQRIVRAILSRPRPMIR